MKAQRWRITFSKTEAMRFTGHLDLILTWERTFRRSGLPLSYSEGFNPRPVLNLAAPLPLGFTSKGEIGDFWLSEIITKDDFLSSLEVALPPGLQIREIEELAEIHRGKLPSLVKGALYSMEIPGSYPELPTTIQEITNAASLIRERKGKSYDLRPLILDLQLVQSDPSSSTLETTLSLLPGATGRPEEVLFALGLSPLQASICRERILLKDSPVSK